MAVVGGTDLMRYIRARLGIMLRVSWKLFAMGLEPSWPLPLAACCTILTGTSYGIVSECRHS